jgi:copper homeostasis protein
MTTVEILATSVDGVRAAIRGGAGRIELCQDLADGGTTPSVGLITAACRISLPVEIPVMVMIRPRGGDFAYDSDEVAVMKTDITAARECGAAGVVIGCLDSEGLVDQVLTQTLVATAVGLHVTFHRAVDVAADPEVAARDAFATGCDRVLTSGGAPNAWAGRSVIARVVATAPKNCQAVAAGGISPDNVQELVAATGVDEVHASARTAAKGRADLRFAMGPRPDWPNGSWPVPDAEQVRQLSIALRA